MDQKGVAVGAPGMPVCWGLGETENAVPRAMGDQMRGK